MLDFKAVLMLDFKENKSILLNLEMSCTVNWSPDEWLEAIKQVSWLVVAHCYRVDLVGMETM